MTDIQSSSTLLRQFRNCRLLKNGKLVWEHLWVRNGIILDPRQVFFAEKNMADIQTDCKGAILCPGFIEAQINGAFGVDFSSPSNSPLEDLQKVAKGLLAHGVTSLCPTVITSPSCFYKKVLPQYKKLPGSKNGASILGLHIEGPFISVEKRGAHQTEYIRSLENGIDDMYGMYGSLDNVAILTLAPELPYALEVVEHLVGKGISVSLGHSTANLAQGEAAAKAGANFITHLFNAMLPFHHRDPHLVGLLASDEVPDGRIFYGIISDGIHTHPSALRIAHRTHPKGVVLVTDAIPAMGLGLGTHHMGEQVVEVKTTGAYIAGTNTLCGSVATMNECVKYFKHATGCSTVDALEAATLHPAQMLRITDRKGTLDYGTDADFVVLDDDLNLTSTYIAGEVVWTNQQ